jgi:Zn-dependent protease with chaperone function
MIVRRPFASLLAVSGLGLALTAAMLLVAFPPPPLGAVLRRCVESGTLCASLVRFGHQVGTPLFLALLPWSLCRGLGHGVRQWWSTRRVVGCLCASGTRAMPAGMQALCARLGLQGRLTLVDVDAPIAFCHGLWRPRVWLSTGTLRLLSQPEAAAVLRHEQAHLRLRHPLQLLVARSAAAAFPFLPVLRELTAAVARSQELAADRAVIGAGERFALGRALLALTTAPGAATMQLPVPAMTGALDARLDQLIGGHDVPPRLSRRALALTWLAFALGVLLLRLGSMGLPPQHTVLGLFELPPVRLAVSWPCLALSCLLAGLLQVASVALAGERA